MPYDSNATRRRLLDAAIEEFSVNGLAGARVQVIADRARANKQAIYGYFGSKEELFVAAYTDRIAQWRASIDFDEYDLPASAGRMFDRYAESPETWRLMFWAAIESGGGRPPLPALADMYREYSARIESAQSEGKVTTRYSAPMLLGLIRSLVLTWQTQATELGMGLPEKPSERRDIIIEALTSLLDDSKH